MDIAVRDRTAEAAADQRRPHDDFYKYLELVNNCDEDDPLLSETPLGQCLDRIQLARVPPGQLIQLNQALNVEQLIPTKNGLARDYRGLAELMGFSLIELEARFKRSHNPAKCLIEAFADKCRHERSREVTVNDLIKLIETIERFDIIDDFLPTLIELAVQERQLLARLGGTNATNHDDENKLKLKQPQQQITFAQSNRQTTTHHDQLDRAAKYDAFVCFANEDEDYASELILSLERHNKRVVTMEHLLPGQFEYDALVQLIATECRKVIIILTPNFLLSRECEFQTKFANEIAIKSGWFPKIIPVLCEPIDDARLPPLIRVISKIDMTNSRANNHDWQLRKLLGSLEYNSGLQESYTGVRAGMLYEPPGDRFRQQQQQQQQQQRFSYVKNAHGDQRPGQTSNFSGNHLTAEPIVDLAYSQSSDSAMNLSCQLSIMTASNDDQQSELELAQRRQHTPDDESQDARRQTPQSRLSTPSPSSNTNHRQPPQSSCSSPANQLNPLNWYKSFKRKVLPKSPCESIVPSTSSRAKLIQEPPDDRS
jgi:myeloid differentiation primary response protein MyD88